MDTVGREDPKTVLGLNFRVELLPEDDSSAVAIDAERTGFRGVSKLVDEGRGTVDVVRCYGSEDGAQLGT